jgi:hypothetical protein
MSNKLYLNGRLCNGTGRSIYEYTKTDLIKIARENNITIPKGSNKASICQLLIDTKAISPKFAPKKNTYSSIEKLMEYLDVKDARKLINMTDTELEDVISKIKLYNGKTSMSEYLKGKTGSERAKAFLISMSEKYCRCLKGVESNPKKSYVSANAICSSSVFNTKGLKGPGASYQCSPIPLLLPSKDSKFVLEKK